MNADNRLQKTNDIAYVATNIGLTKDIVVSYNGGHVIKALTRCQNRRPEESVYYFYDVNPTLHLTLPQPRNPRRSSSESLGSTPPRFRLEPDVWSATGVDRGALDRWNVSVLTTWFAEPGIPVASASEPSCCW